VGLPEKETRAYIEHHLKLASVNHALFSDEAIRLVHQFTKGIPRRINNLPTQSLLACFIDEKPLIDEATVKKALASLRTTWQADSRERQR